MYTDIQTISKLSTVIFQILKNDIFINILMFD